MTMLSPSRAEDALYHVVQQFTHWRRSRSTPRGRIPPALWDQAVALTREVSLTRVAKQLGLCPQRLRKRCKEKAGTASVPSMPTALPFVEVHPAWRVPTAEVEVQRPDGQRLRLSLYEASPALVVLLRTFVERR
ncbi:MAG: hypothetical protein AB7N24_24080 [Dehalococcoidia bacterium]